MAKLEKYSSFKALKSQDKSADKDRLKDDAFPEFENFLKQLQKEYANKMKPKSDNGKQFS